MEKIEVFSNTEGRLGINLPELRFSRQWPSKGSKVSIDKEIFEQMMYDAGTRYMFESGMLYTKNLEVLKEVGLEPEDAEEPVNIIILSDAQRKRYMSVLPFVEFKKALEDLGYEELHNLASYAIQNKLTDFDKCAYIKSLIGIDIIKAIELNIKDKED